MLKYTFILKKVKNKMWRFKKLYLKSKKKKKNF